MGNVTAPDLRIEYVAIGELHPDPTNPRRISDAELEALTRSIREFGLVDPIIARHDDKIVIGGHQRLLAARKLGLDTVPVVFVDLPAEKAKLLNVALNKISGEWDQEMLARLLADLEGAAGLDLTLSGFAEDEVSKLLKSLDSREKRTKPESFDLDAALEEAMAAAGVSRGDLWALGDHRLLCGDATDSADVARLLGGERAAMCFTDPPYNVGLGDHGAQQPGQRKRRLRTTRSRRRSGRPSCEAGPETFLTTSTAPFTSAWQ